MNFYDEIIVQAGLPPETTVGSKVVLVGKRAFYVEGHRGLIEMTDCAVTFRYKKGSVTVRGECLKVTKVTEDEGYVVGKIAGIEVGDAR